MQQALVALRTVWTQVETGCRVLRTKKNMELSKNETISRAHVLGQSTICGSVEALTPSLS